MKSHAHTRQTKQQRRPTGGGHKAPPDSSETAPAPEIEPSEGQTRQKQLREVEAALKEIKESLEKLTGLAQAQTKALEGQWARVSMMREVAEVACNREAYLQAYGRMWT